MNDGIDTNITDGTGGDGGYEGDDFTWVDPYASEWDKLTTVSTTLATFSIAMSLATLLVFTLMRYYLPTLSNRVSLRLVSFIAIADIVYECAWMGLNYVTYADTPECTTVMYFIVAGNLASVFMSAAIALNIFLVFVIKFGVTPIYERMYYIASASVAILLPIIAVATKRLGYNGDECWFRGPPDDLLNGIGPQWGFLYGWITLVCILCSIATFLFWYVLYQNQKQLRDIPNRVGSTAASAKKNNKARKKEQLVNKAVSRISWYCVVPLLAQSWNIILDVYLHLGGSYETFTSVWITYLACIFAALQGTMNSTIFLLLDPTVGHAREALRKHLVQAHYLKYMCLETQSTTAMTSPTSPTSPGTSHRMSMQHVHPTIVDPETASQIPVPEGLFQNAMFWFTKQLLLRSEDLEAKTPLRSDTAKAAARGSVHSPTSSEIPASTTGVSNTEGKVRAVALL
ncbi:uncharacterized protein SPPG_06689 [Spizellomyces punctatus DAOM BR117]|uniref:G-protein coupled receptors family 2 profile 2 domain-containing protein n=1 Tax=Spizellomyces punctatus (strain DAOM BR117) TaxID=645134 RepID=A0A0L0HBZ8_SPIPD|nr:uncharacterized protein SPPG_06689 [Spizellomyces punctatus DAOM BR117]KNC98293.1 hypothetical protein SPPG_06689 [Spizellomyces punctatus DAOM BR117]|eukprot:XP_016606333.1 hypothetical protein SPPG_06689 [Spizellomyces punctatus DAOM BR117]